MLLAVVLVGFAVFADAAPRSRSKVPQLVYDQKQNGDYNVQVHLKDFQVIALIGEDSLGGLGDYDYNYDYSDFTVKPAGSSSTAQTSQDISSTTTPKISEVYITSTKPTEIASTSSKPSDENADIKLPTTGKPLGLLGETKPEDLKAPSDSTTTDKKDDLPSSTEKLAETTKKQLETQPADAVPGQIQVQVIQSPEGYPNLAVRKDTTEEKGTSGKSSENKCLTGFSRDKRGRCRRVRKPQNALPFNFGRLAHLASRFRSSDGSANSDFVKTHSLK